MIRLTGDTLIRTEPGARPRRLSLLYQREVLGAANLAAHDGYRDLADALYGWQHKLLLRASGMPADGGQAA